MTEIIAIVSAGIALISLFYGISRNNNQDTFNIHTRIAHLETNVTRLETQMEPFWKIIEDSVLKSVIHNPLTVDERAILDKYHSFRNEKSLSEFLALDELLVARSGLQRELKELEENWRAAAESTLPYVLTLAAIDRRLEKDYDFRAHILT